MKERRSNTNGHHKNGKFSDYYKFSIQMEADTEANQSSNVAYVFPGQGAQFVGMGRELYQSSKAAKELYDEVDDILSFPLTRLLMEGPEEELQKTVNSQPAIMATSLACLAALNEVPEHGYDRPAALAGHSLGEYTSLVVSGATSLEDGMRLVQERGRLMQEASEAYPGSMAAIIGLDEVTLEEICLETGAEMANINGAEQIVLSGDRLCVARAIDLASMRGAKRAIPLAVGGAFHSSLMSPAAEGLKTAMESVELRDPVVPIIANSSCDPLTTGQEVKNELMAQLCSCVQWERSVGCMINLGVSDFIEFGPGKVLGGLIKRIGSSPLYKDRHVEVLNVTDLSSARQVAEARAKVAV